MILRLNGAADVRRSHSFFAQGDGQVFGPVGLHQRHFIGGLVGQFHLEGPQVYRGGLGLGLELLLKGHHVKRLQKEVMGRNVKLQLMDEVRLKGRHLSLPPGGHKPLSSMLANGT